MPFGGVVGQVLDELPIVAVGIEKVDSFSPGMLVGNGRIFVAGGGHSFPQRVGIVYFVRQMVDAGNAGVGLPAFGWLDGCFIQRDVRLVGSDVHPADSVWVDLVGADAEFGERGLQESNCGVDIPDDQIGMFEASTRFDSPVLTLRVAQDSTWVNLRRSSKVSSSDQDAGYGQHDCQEGEVAPQRFLNVDDPT